LEKGGVSLAYRGSWHLSLYLHDVLTDWGIAQYDQILFCLDGASYDRISLSKCYPRSRKNVLYLSTKKEKGTQNEYIRFDRSYPKHPSIQNTRLCNTIQRTQDFSLYFNIERPVL
jgi:hypothetical protein